MNVINFPVTNTFYVGTKCLYSVSRETGARKQIILSELGADPAKYEVWAKNIDMGYQGEMPKNAPMPILKTDRVKKKETTELQQTAGVWNVPRRLCRPEWG